MSINLNSFIVCEDFIPPEETLQWLFLRLLTDVLPDFTIFPFNFLKNYHLTVFYSSSLWTWGLLPKQINYFCKLTLHWKVYYPSSASTELEKHDVYWRVVSMIHSSFLSGRRPSLFCIPRTCRCVETERKQVFSKKNLEKLNLYRVHRSAVHWGRTPGDTFLL